MGTLDAVLLVIVAVSAILGAIKGVVRQIGIVIGVVVGITLALRHGASVATWLGRWIGSVQVRGVVGPTVAFLGAYLAIVAVAALLHRLLAKAALGWVNRTAGATLGAATSVLVMGAALLIAVAHVPSARAGISRSPVAVEIIRGSQAMITLVPDEVRYAFSHGWEEVQSMIRAYRAHAVPALSAGDSSRAGGDRNP